MLTFELFDKGSFFFQGKCDDEPTQLHQRPDGVTFFKGILIEVILYTVGHVMQAVIQVYFCQETCTESCRKYI